MAISTINKLNFTDEDISNPVICPKCGKTVGMRLFGAEDKSTVGKLFPEKCVFLVLTNVTTPSV